jgi:hypothetical protein
MRYLPSLIPELGVDPRTGKREGEDGPLSSRTFVYPI